MVPDQIPLSAAAKPTLPKPPPLQEASKSLDPLPPPQPFLSPRNTTFEGSQPTVGGQEEVRRGGPIGTEAPVSPVYPPRSPGQIWIWSPDIAAEAGPGPLAHLALFPCPVCLGQSCLSIPGKFITIGPSTIPVYSIILSIN